MSFKLNAYVEPHYPIKKSVLNTAATSALNAAKVKSKVELSISVVGDRKIKSLNKKYRGIDAPTDVLAFSFTLDSSAGKGFVSQPSNYLFLGDIIISYPQLIDRASKEDMLVDEMAALLTTHGTLHLLGYDHEKTDDATKMESLEDEILTSLRPAPEIIK